MMITPNLEMFMEIGKIYKHPRKIKKNNFTATEKSVHTMNSYEHDIKMVSIYVIITIINCFVTNVVG